MTPLVALPRLIWAALGLLAVITAAAVLQQGATRAGGSAAASAVAACAGLLLGLLVARKASGASARLADIRRTIESLPSARALTTIVLTGVLLRSLAAAMLGPAVTPDGAIYLDLSSRLLEGRGYVDPDGGRAFWPPGYPLILAAARLLPGLSDPAAAAIALNLVSFVVAAIATYRIGGWLYGRAAGLAAATLLALWPNLVLGASLAGRELPLLALVTAAVLLYLYARRADRFAALGCGLALGLATLVQPSLLLLPVVLVPAEVLHPEGWRPAAARLAIIVTGMLLAVGPWVAHTHSHLGAVVPIATSGGDAFYRANNPWVLPGQSSVGPVDLRPLPEVERSRQGTRLALEWIVREPHRFLALSWQRLLRFSGNDAASAGDATSLDAASNSRAQAALAGLSNAAWLALWLAILVAVANGAAQSAAAPGAWLLVLVYLYAVAVESIAAGSALHHVPFTGLLAVLAASALAGRPVALHPGAAGRGRHPAIQFIDFAVVGAVGTAAHFTTLILLVQAALWPPVVATTAGFLVGAVVNYVLNYSLTFQSQARHGQALPRFLAIAFASMLLNLALFSLLVHALGLHYLLGQLIATAIVLIVNFAANRALTFTSSRHG